jgi:hypothetical protein
MPQWIYVDLGSVQRFDRVVLRWTAGMHATVYGLYVWTGYAWALFYSTTTGDGGVDDVALWPVSGRYVLMYAYAGASTALGLEEYEIYGSAGPGLPPPPLKSDRFDKLPLGAGVPVPEGAVLPKE